MGVKGQAQDPYLQGFRFSSFPRQRESNKLLKRLDTRFHGYDDTQFMSESPDFITTATLKFLAPAPGAFRPMMYFPCEATCNLSCPILPTCNGIPWLCID